MYYCYSKSAAKFFITLFFLGFYIFSFAQKTTYSPFTRLGLGELTQGGMAWDRAMGYSTTAYSRGGLINIKNPAANTLFLSPAMNVMGEGQYSVLKNKNQSQEIQNFTIQSFNYGFNLGKKTAMGFGLIPLSRVGYVLNEGGELDSTTTYTQEFQGNGGINRAYIQASRVLLSKKSDSTLLSVGTKISYLFGSIEQERSIWYNDQNVYGTNFQEQSIYKDFYLDFGALFSFFPFETKPLKLSFGFTYAPQQQVNLSFQRLIQNFKSTGVHSSNRDTVSFVNNETEKATMPVKFGFGVAAEWDSRLTFSADFEKQNWTDYKHSSDFSGMSNALKDQTHFGIGVSYIHNRNTLFNAPIYQFITYRAGAYYNSGYVQANNKALSEYGMTFGLEIPLRSSKSGSSIQLGIQHGKRGDIAKNLIQEKYTYILFGVNLRPNFVDRWFYKRKYD